MFRGYDMYEAICSGMRYGSTLKKMDGNLVNRAAPGLCC